MAIERLYAQRAEMDTFTKTLIILAVIFVVAGMVVMGSIDWVVLSMGLELFGVVCGCFAMIRIESDDVHHVKFKRR